VLTVASLLFSSDVQSIVINPITQMVGIIKTLADDPLKKPKKPEPKEENIIETVEAKNQMKTGELEKTIFRIGNLLQMSFGQLGALIIRENVTSGDGQLEVMIPGHRINVIFMMVRIGNFVQIANAMDTKVTEYINKVVRILHECSDRWSGWANKNEGDRYMLTWKVPDVDEAENERNEALQE